MIHSHQFPPFSRQPRTPIDPRAELLIARLELLVLQAELELKDLRDRQRRRFWLGLAAGLATALLVIF